MSLRNAQVRATAAVSDMARAVAFYQDTLGLTPLADDSEMADHVRIYPCGNDSLLQVYESEHAGTSRATVASFSTGDFAAVVDELLAKGVAFETYDDPPSDARGVHTFGAHQVAWLTDPDGNTLAIDNGASPS